jgi:anti-sigma B factor antagonist
MPVGNRQRTVEIQHHPGRTVVSLHGDIDLATVAGLEDALCEVRLDADAPVVVDLSDVTHLSCRGMAALASTHDALAARGVGLVLRHPGPVVRRFLGLVGLDGLCE